MQPSTSVEDTSGHFGSNSFQSHGRSLMSNQNFELKSASTSSLANSNTNNNNSSSSSNNKNTMYQSYQNGKLTTYDSVSSSPSPLTLPLASSNSNDVLMSSHQLHSQSGQHLLSSMSSHSLGNNNNINRPTSYRPQSSSSSSSSNHNHQNPAPHYHHQPHLSHVGHNHQYETQNSYSSNQLTSSQHQYHLNRQMSIPSPSSVLVNAMTPLSLVSTQQTIAFDNVPISLPQRDLNYFN